MKKVNRIVFYTTMRLVNLSSFFSFSTCNQLFLLSQRLTAEQEQLLADAERERQELATQLIARDREVDCINNSVDS